MKTAWKVIAGTLAVALVLLLAAEIGLRNYIASQIRGEVSQEAEPEVSFGSTPVTLGLLGGALPHVSLYLPSTLAVNGDNTAGQPATTVDVTRLHLRTHVADDLTASAELPDDFLRAQLQQQLSHTLNETGGTAASLLGGIVSVSGVHSNPSEGTFTISLSNGLAGIDLRPVVDNGELTFEAPSSSLFGVALPQSAASVLTDILREQVGSIATGELQITDLTPVDGGLRATLTGQNVDLSSLGDSLP
ncbi:hypothetical protein CAPI_00915 [Corynebacterium capitovis DSM 44611]|uniref:LmeA family phospholipid-binding protein n=1 Tax=Corynebacterium capitovis TaxID=131081 RepID=UPI000362AA2E|nr:DUF2993 domain-containing protein [Corynebacterium capitovis]WKD56761.1 hypothetical protein CAPI_00915 [Corynebacterium capitovis DSM 44611]